MYNRRQVRPQCHQRGLPFELQKHPPLVRSPIIESKMSSNQLLILESRDRYNARENLVEEVQTSVLQDSTVGFSSFRKKETRVGAQ
jgi:hypothetical protein